MGYHFAREYYQYFCADRVISLVDVASRVRLQHILHRSISKNSTPEFFAGSCTSVQKLNYVFNGSDRFTMRSSYSPPTPCSGSHRSFCRVQHMAGMTSAELRFLFDKFCYGCKRSRYWYFDRGNTDLRVHDALAKTPAICLDQYTL